MASQAFINEAYLAYFGRPADPGGMAYYASSSEYEIERGFSASAESEALYGSTFGYDQVNLIYRTLFNHDADIDGMTWYVNEVLNHRMLPAEVAVKILQGAQGSDLVIVENKLAAAEMFTSHLNTTQEYVGYAGYDATASARAYLATIGSTAATAAEVDAAILAACSASTSNGQIFMLTDSSASNPDLAAVKTMHITGDQDVRIDMTNTTSQITGLDLDGDGVIENNGVENALNVKPASGYAAVDAYARLTNGVMNETNLANVFLGDIKYDGTGYAGDGVSTDGNVVLGGLGADTLLGGIGNDFFAAGGVAQSRVDAALAAWVASGKPTTTFVAPTDSVSAGRNADFIFAELSLLSKTDGNGLFIDGGATADNTSAANGQSSQDSDWLLLQASDDDERIEVVLTENAGVVGTTVINDGTLSTRAGQYGTLRDIENLDASGNTYGFIKGLNTTVGGAPTNANNNGIGSSGQLNVNGSAAANIIVGGYDNDAINAGAGDDLVMGGNLKSYAADGVTVAHQILDPNLVGLVGNNDGRDELTGGAGSDNILFEADGGVIEGGETQNVDDAEIDTLWLTQNSLGATVTAAAVTPVAASALTTDGVLRFDLAAGKVGGLDNASGYGGADQNAATGGYTADQTNYTNAALRVQTQDMENVIATGLGGIDYKAAGSNSAADLTFQNQQNFQRYNGDLDLRGTADANTLYASGGNDTVEGRMGNDLLSGGDGIDTFVFGTMNAGDAAAQGGYGDNIDVIWRQSDTNADNLWDTDATGAVVYEKDFGVGASTTASASGLHLTLNVSATDTTSNPLVANDVREIDITVAGTDVVLTTAGMAAATTMADLLVEVQSALTAYGDANLSASLVNNTITITDATGRVLGGSGYVVVQASGGSIQNTVTFEPSLSNTVKDVILFTSYEDRLDGELTNDSSSNGSTISLGVDSYAEDRVVSFTDNDGTVQTRIAEDQAYAIKFANLTTQDVVTIAVNGVTYQLTVGKELDGSAIAAEDGVNDTQAGIQTAFLTRLTTFINSFMDHNTAAGQVAAALAGDTLTLTQVAYNGEETVFMKSPLVTLGNASGGEPATAVVTNAADHEVLLYGYAGTDNGLNVNNVEFIGSTGTNQSTLETAKAAGQTLIGNEAVVIDSGADDLVSTVTNTPLPATTPAMSIANNTFTNAPLNTVNFGVHGDDLLIGGAGSDTIYGRTGDDRVIGSLGNDVVDGGKNWYAVKVLGETQARVVEMNVWEAASPVARVTALAGLTVTATTLINQTEDGATLASGIYDDTLMFQQADIGTNASFTITLDDFAVDASTNVISLTHGGAGKVAIDAAGDGTLDSDVTTFTNFENVRTVSGTGLAIANNGQGNDTLNVAALSSAADGISYDLTSTATQGEVKYSINAGFNEVALAAGVTESVKATATLTSVRNAIINAQETAAFRAQVLAIPVLATTTIAEFLTSVGNLSELSRPTSANDTQVPALSASDYETLVMKVDGVENIIGGTGDDLLLIAENEAAKNNGFDGATGVDRIEYQNKFATLANEPTVTIKVNTATDVDQVVMTGGLVAAAGTLGATDTLTGVEYITLEEQTAQSTREDDVLDVTAMTTGAVVDYTNGQVRTGLATDSGVQVTIENIVQLENVWADGNDTVIVATAATMGTNTTSDVAANAKAINVATYLDYDEQNAAGTARVSFTSQTNAGLTVQAINQNQFTFDMSRVGTDADVDTIDYSNETGMITAVMNFAANDTTKYVLVQNADGTLNNVNNRIDKLVSVERIVAAQGANSTIDLTSADRDTNVVFSYNMPEAKALFVEGTQMITVLDRQINTVRVSDAADQSALGNVDLLEYRDLGNSTTTTQTAATWETVQGSDYSEYVGLTQWEDGINHTFNLRGGQNEVNYNERTNGIWLNIGSVDATVDGIAHQFNLTVNQLNTTGALTGSFDTITAFNTLNTFNEGTTARLDTLRIEASQGDMDLINVANVGTSGVFLLGEVETSGSSVVTATFSGVSQGLTMSGFEYLWDAGETAGTGAPIDDTYVIQDLSNFVSKLTLIDYDQTYSAANVFTGSADRDTIKLTDGAFEAASIRAPISHTIDINSALHMGDGTTNDLQWLGVDDQVTRDKLVTGEGSGLAGSIGFDFKVLDISEVTKTATGGSLTNTITAAGSALASATTDELIVGDVKLLNSTVATAITNFDILSLTGSAVSYDFDLDVNELQQLTSNVRVVGFDADMGKLDLSRVTNGTTATIGSTVTVTDVAAIGAEVTGSAFADTITGAAGNDILVGNAGNDTLNAGIATEIRTMNVTGVMDAVAGDSVTLNFNGYASALTTVTEGAELVVGAGNDAVGAALALKINANLAAINTGAAWTGGAALASAAYDSTTDQLTFSFVAGVNVADPIIATYTDAGTLAVSAETAVNGGTGGNNVFYGGAGIDVINGGAGDDSFVVAGTYAAGTYAAGSQGVFSTVLTDAELVAAHTTDTTADTYAGGAGYDVIEQWGTVSYAAATLSGIEVINAHSNITLTKAQFDMLSTVVFNGTGAHTLTIVNNDGSAMAAADQALLIADLGYVEVTSVGGDATTTYTLGGVTYTGAGSIPDNVEVKQTILPSATSIDEGQAVTFSLSGFAAGTLAYTLSGATAGVDYTGADNGTVTIAADGTASLVITTLADNTTEGAETLTLTAGGVTGAVVINDTSLTPAYTYVVTPAPASVAEGAAVTFTVNTSAPDGTFAYTLGGTATSGLDYTAPAALTMSVVGGVGSVTINTLTDALTEGTETLILNVMGQSGTASITDVVAGATTPLVVGSVASYTPTAAADSYSLNVATALASTAATQATIAAGFSVTADSLVFDLVAAQGAITLADLNGDEGISVSANAITGNTTINFGNDAGGNVVAVVLTGVIDTANVHVTVI